MCISQKKELMIMRYTITGRNIEVTPGLKAAVEKKIGKLEHFFTPDTEVIVALSAQKDQQKIEVTIPVKGNTIRAEESSTDMYVSIDLVEEIIERQIRRYKKKLISRSRVHLHSPRLLSRMRKILLMKMISRSLRPKNLL